MIVDAHLHSATHIGGAHVRTAGRYGVVTGPAGEFQLLPPCFDPSACPPEMTLRFMDWVGIDHALLIQGLYYGWHNGRESRCVASGRIGSQGCIGQAG